MARTSLRWLLTYLSGMLFVSSIIGCDKYSKRNNHFRNYLETTWEFTWNSPNDPYLKRLRTQYNLDDLIRGLDSDLDRVIAVNHWTHGLWKHSIENPPQGHNPISIIEKAKQGSRFSCLEYSIVASACLNSLGIRARTLNLIPRIAERGSPGWVHVVVEVYLKDQKKWIMIDPQHDVVAYRDDIPLNAVEITESIYKAWSDIRIPGKSPEVREAYLKWIKRYLFYLEIRIDNRYASTKPFDWSRRTILLGPKGARKPEWFNQGFGSETIYTHSPTKFYKAPASG